MRERIELIRRLTAHRSGPFRYEGQFDHVSMAHYDRTALPDSLTILAAGVGEHMVRVAGECADGAILYPPHFGVDPERIHANELSLIEVASGWTA